MNAPNSNSEHDALCPFSVVWQTKVVKDILTSRGFFHGCCHFAIKIDVNYWTIEGMKDHHTSPCIYRRNKVSSSNHVDPTLKKISNLIDMGL